MALVIREFETMVDDTLQRIVDANIGITNVLPGSVIRTIVEAILAETDIQNYTIEQIYRAMNIDTATDEDLDAIVSILGVVRKQATYAEGTITFGRSDVYDTDINIQYAQIVSTRQDNNTGIIHEFIVTDSDAKLPKDQLKTAVNIRALNPGRIYLPAGSITIMSTPIIGIEYVTNEVEFSSGTDKETDEELRARAKQALAGLGKGTNAALRSALLDVDGVDDVIVMDMNRGVGTADIIAVTSEIPPSITLQNEVNDIISITKPAGIHIEVIYPTIISHDIAITLIDISGTMSAIPAAYISSAGHAIMEYCSSLSVGDTFIISQLERAIGNAISDNNIDVETTMPSANVTPASTEVIRHGTITINGVIWNE